MRTQTSIDERPTRRCSGWRERGQGLVEMSMLLPLFLILIVGVIEVSGSLNAYVTIVDAARDGARLGSKDLATDTEIRNLVILETNRLRDTIQPNDVSVSYMEVDDEDAIRVEVCNDRTLLLSIPLVMPDSFRMCSATTMRVLPSGT